MRVALKQKRSKNRARQKVVKSSERLSITVLPGRHNRSLAKQSVGRARVFLATFCFLGEDSDLSGFVGKKKKFLFMRSHRTLQQSKKLFRTFSSGRWQMVKKIIKKKLTDIDKASRCALAELSRLVRKTDFNNSWGEKMMSKIDLNFDKSYQGYVLVGFVRGLHDLWSTHSRRGLFRK